MVNLYAIRNLRSLLIIAGLVLLSVSLKAQFANYAGWVAGNLTHSVTPYTGFTASYNVTNTSSFVAGYPNDDADAGNFLDLAVDWPNTSSSTTFTITLNKPVLGASFYIYDIDAGSNSGNPPYSYQDVVTISAINYTTGLPINGITETTVGTDASNTVNQTSSYVAITGKKRSTNPNNVLNTITYDPNIYVSSITITYSSGTTNISGDAANNPVAQIIYISRLSFAIILPVQFNNFSAQAINNHADLKWGVAGETPNKAYTVERSTDGISFTAIAEVNAQNKLTQANYQYTDFYPKQGVNYYRIRYINESGEIKYSEVKALNFSKVNHGIRIYPNPVAEKLNIQVSDYQNIGSAEIISMYGTRIKTLILSQNSSPVATDDLAAGMYYIVIRYKDGLMERTSFIKR